MAKVLGFRTVNRQFPRIPGSGAWLFEIAAGILREAVAWLTSGLPVSRDLADRLGRQTL
jgi:hypothetical protein